MFVIYKVCETIRVSCVQSLAHVATPLIGCNVTVSCERKIGIYTEIFYFVGTKPHVRFFLQCQSDEQGLETWFLTFGSFVDVFRAQSCRCSASGLTSNAGEDVYSQCFTAPTMTQTRETIVTTLPARPGKLSHIYVISLTRCR